MSEYPLSTAQRLWTLLREAAEDAASNMQKCAGVKDGIAYDDFAGFDFERGREAAFRHALQMLEALDLDAAAGGDPVEPDRSYGP